jgi:hypothetical protein
MAADPQQTHPFELGEGGYSQLIREQSSEANVGPSTELVPPAHGGAKLGPDRVQPSDGSFTSDVCSLESAGAHADGALTTGGIDIFAPQNLAWRLGFLAQYFAVGILYAGLPATCYGFFLGYLSVPAHTYATVVVMTSLPWSFKLFFGVLNDTVPIGGQRRKPYMVIGWSFCAAMLLLLALQPLPPPYWCIGEDGRYTKQRTAPDGTTHAAEPCHPDSARAGGSYALLMILAATGYVVADVAADGLTVEYARAEPTARRGTTQTTAYLTRALGQAIASLIVGFGMNSHAYNGSFQKGLSFSAVMALFAVPALAMVPVTALLVREPVATKRLRSLGEYADTCWGLVRGGGVRLRGCCPYAILPRPQAHRLPLALTRSPRPSPSSLPSLAAASLARPLSAPSLLLRRPLQLLLTHGRKYLDHRR